MKELEKIAEETKHQLVGDFTRKSLVGAIYRVGASFTMDAIYLSLAAAGAYYFRDNCETADSICRGFSDFVGSLDPAKLARVSIFVVGINFVDYKCDVTNRLDQYAKRLLSKK